MESAGGGRYGNANRPRGYSRPVGGVIGIVARSEVV